MAMDGGREDDAPAHPTRGPDDAVEQDAVQRRCRGKGIAGASSSGAAGASYSGAIPRGTMDSNGGVEVTAKDGKSTN